MEPPAFFARNNMSARNHPDFVRAAIQELLEGGCIEEVAFMPHCCNPLTVADGKKMRLVLDLRHVNQFVKYQQFRYETWQDVSKVVTQGCYFLTFDFKSGYHHIKLLPQHRKYFGFSFSGPTGSR